MDTWIYLSQGFAVAMTPENLVIALIGCFVGTIVGLLPGLGPINGDGLYRLRIRGAYFLDTA